MQFAGWVDEFAGIDVPADLAGLDAAVFHQDRYMAKLAVAVAAMDAERDWDVAGYPSAAGWLQARGVTGPDAQRLVTLGKKLARLPVLAAAWLSGELNGGEVHAIHLNVVERHVELFASHEAALVPSFVGLTVSETGRAMSLWRARADAIHDGPAPRDPHCEARLARTLDDRGVLNASLDAEGVAALANAALDVADSHDLDVPACQRRGQALKDVFRWFLDHQHITTPGRRRPHVNLSVRDDTIHTDHVEGHDVESGVRFDSPTLRRYLCDCEFHRMLLSSQSAVLDYGRGLKDPPVDLYNAVVARDQHCRGCGRPASWCHVHHVKWWHRDKGDTNIGNLVLLCARCHGLVHRTGWTNVLHPDGTFDITTPHGETRRTHPPGWAPTPELNWGDEIPAPPRRTGDPFDDYVDTRALILTRLRQLVTTN